MESIISLLICAVTLVILVIPMSKCVERRDYLYYCEKINQVDCVEKLKVKHD